MAGKIVVGLASHWPCVTEICSSPPTGWRPRRGRWAPAYALLWSMVDFTFTAQPRWVSAESQVPTVEWGWLLVVLWGRNIRHALSCWCCRWLKTGLNGRSLRWDMRATSSASSALREPWGVSWGQQGLKSNTTLTYTVYVYWCHALWDIPRAGSGVIRIDPLRFLAGCRTRRLNQVWFLFYILACVYCCLLGPLFMYC